ncbi:Dynactin subunit 2, variant 2 [Balamuthia mandrillaris]
MSAESSASAATTTKTVGPGGEAAPPQEQGASTAITSVEVVDSSFSRPLVVTKGEPEVFETEDVAEEPTPVLTDEAADSSDDIDRSLVPPNKAFARFWDKSFDLTKTDYTESLGKIAASTSRRGGASRKRWEDEDAEKEPETPVQRFYRLQREVKELSEELHVSGQTQPTPLEQGIASLQLTNELKQLQRELSMLTVEEGMAPLFGALEAAQQKQGENLIRRLQAHLAALDASSSSSSSSSTSKNKDKEGLEQVIYELYCNSALSSSPGGYQKQLMRVNELDQRIALLEKCIGGGSGNALPQGLTDSSSLVAAVQDLKQKLSLLNPTSLEAVDRKMKMLSQELDEVTSKNEKARLTSQQEEKVNEVFEMMQRVDSAAEQMSAVINRLQALKTIHEESLSFAQTIKSLQAQQDEITNLLKSHNSLLQQVHSFTSMSHFFCFYYFALLIRKV